MTIYLPELSPDSFQFPSPHEALEEPNGLLAFGGDLQPERVLSAYHQGIFPWYSPDEPILWWSPAPRAVFLPEMFQPSKSLRKFQRKANYHVTINHATPDVINLCASTRLPEKTWLTEEMRRAYCQLAELGHCHSVEVWEQDALVGGLYGIQVGQLFCGESMFSLADNASKIGLWYFCHHFSHHGGKLIDCQVMNDHLASLGATEMSRDHFIEHLETLKAMIVHHDCYQPQSLTLKDTIAENSLTR